MKSSPARLRCTDGESPADSAARRIGWIFAGLLMLAVLSACTSHIGFAPYTLSQRPTPASTHLGVHYTSGTLERIDLWKSPAFMDFNKWKVHTGQAVESDLTARLRPIIKKMTLSPTAWAENEEDLVLSIGIEQFAFKSGRAEIVLAAALRGPGGAVLFDKLYTGHGTAHMAKEKPKSGRYARAITDTTREAVQGAVKNILEDLRPFLTSAPPAKEPPNGS